MSDPRAPPHPAVGSSARGDRNDQFEAGHCPAFFLLAETWERGRPDTRIRSMRRIRLPFNRPGLFQECVSEVPDRYGQQFRLLFLGSKENKIDEAFGHVRG